jgi:hypothetical protein
VFHLACSSTDLKSVSATGPCAMPDASLSSYLGNGSVYVGSQVPGACHVELTFASGFTYSTEVAFVSQPGGVCGGPQCKCGDYVAPASGPFAVKNPSDTCVEAGPDGGGDESTVAASCPSGASQSVPCALPGSCMGCRYNVRFECTCADAPIPDAGDGGLRWQCIDTGFPCTQGNP